MIESRDRRIWFVVTPSTFTTSGYYVAVHIDNGRTHRTNGFTTWAALLGWLALQPTAADNPRHADSMVTLDNYRISVRSI